ncbi:MAG: aldo/keto reductase [Sphaerochaetaceae bacterium]
MAIQNLQDTVLLHNGVRMPGFGLGVFRVKDGDEVINSVRTALANGYRMIDTAAIYGNEQGVGQALRESGVPRNQVFVTSKVWNADQGYDSTLRAYDESLKRLDMEYLDLFLIHWPVKGKYVETWKALVQLYDDKRVRAIGVSNFHIHHLNDIMDATSVVPVIDQVELHPLLSQIELRAFCKEQAIQMEAWSPLMKGNLDIPVLLDIAKHHKKTPAQVVLRWHIQHEIVVIPKSIHEQRIIENSLVFDFALTQEEMAQINALNQNQRFGSDPDNFNF